MLSYLFDDSWILKEERNYYNIMKKWPFLISDWNNARENISIPTAILSSAYDNSIINSYSYHFMDELDEAKDVFADFYKNNTKATINKKNFAVSNNSTTSIYLSLAALCHLKLRRFLVVTPIYFSFLKTLQLHNCEMIYYHLIDKNDFLFDLNKMEELFKWQKVDGLIFSDPVFCVGKEIPLSVFEEIVFLCNKYKVFIICDYSLGGLNWNFKNPISTLSERIDALTGLNDFIIIDSITKKMCLNGIRNSIIIASHNFIKTIENSADYISGGMCAAQLSIFKELFSYTGWQSVKQSIANNIIIANKNFRIIASIVEGSSFCLYNTDSSYFSILHHDNKNIDQVDYKNMIKKILYNTGVLIFPSQRFSFFNENYFGFRINLLKKRDDLLCSISDTIQISI